MEFYEYIIKAKFLGNLATFKVSSNYKFGKVKASKLKPGMVLPELGLVYSVQKPILKTPLLFKLFRKPTKIELEDFNKVVKSLDEVNPEFWDLEDLKIQEILNQNKIKSIRYAYTGLILEGQSGSTYYISGGCTKNLQEWYNG